MRARYRWIAAALALGAAACSAEADGASGGQGGGRGARPNTTTLAASDVAEVKLSPIDAGWAITGDLQPIERVQVRARLEGDLAELRVREGQAVRAGEVLARFSLAG